MLNKSSIFSPSNELLQSSNIVFILIAVVLMLFKLTNFSNKIFLYSFLFPVIIFDWIVYVSRIVYFFCIIRSWCVINNAAVIFKLAIKPHKWYFISIIVYVAMAIMAVHVFNFLISSPLFISFVGITSSPFALQCSTHFLLLWSLSKLYNSFTILLIKYIKY